MPRLILTRDSVHPGDDVDAPHRLEVALDALPDTPTRLVAWLQARVGDYLPGVAGPATWAAFSGIPLVVWTAQGRDPRPLWAIDIFADRLDTDGDTVRVHLVYFAVQDPEAVYQVLECTLTYRPGRD